MTVFDLPHNHSPRRARRDVEGPIHRAVLQYLRLALRGAVILHPANELQMRGDRAAKGISQNRAKSLGMLPGAPDLLVLWQGRLWAFEVKAPGNRPTAEQARVGAEIVAQGGKWAVVYSVDDAARWVALWRAETPDAATVEVRGVAR